MTTIFDDPAFCRYIQAMVIGFDPAKSRKNSQERGLPFELAADLERERALTAEDARFE